MNNKIVKFAKKFLNKQFIKRHEKTFKNEVKYMYVNKHTEQLLVVFSAFTGERRRYNYFSSLKGQNVSQLYIMDTWGYLGSYYWYENGESKPEQLVSELINTIIIENKIKKVITAGTSKGGTAAIYFGLKHNASDIFSGACQYRVGQYLHRDEHKDILERMMADNSEETVHLLDTKIETQLASKISIDSLIHLFYSTKELTYERQIIPLMADLKHYGYSYVEDINNFPKHDDVGIFFPEYLITSLKSIL